MINNVGLGKLAVLLFLMKNYNVSGQFIKYLLYDYVMEHSGTLNDNRIVFSLTTFCVHD